jgi:hypothetical protein
VLIPLVLISSAISAFLYFRKRNRSSLHLDPNPGLQFTVPPEPEIPLASYGNMTRLPPGIAEADSQPAPAEIGGGYQSWPAEMDVADQPPANYAPTRPPYPQELDSATN